MSALSQTHALHLIRISEKKIKRMSLLLRILKYGWEKHMHMYKYAHTFVKFIVICAKIATLNSSKDKYKLLSWVLV